MCKADDMFLQHRIGVPMVPQIEHVLSALERGVQVLDGATPVAIPTCLDHQFAQRVAQMLVDGPAGSAGPMGLGLTMRAFVYMEISPLLQQ